MWNMRAGRAERAFQGKKEIRGFTLLEVMVAVAILAITLTAIFGSQSQSVSLSTNAKFVTTAALLAQGKISEAEVAPEKELSAGSGNFGKDFPGYSWQMDVRDVMIELPENTSRHLQQIDLNVTWGEDERFQYPLRFYRFIPKGY